MRTASELTASFRSHGLKVTPQRELVFRLLDGNTSHPTAESVFVKARETMSTISLKTVYQVLHDLQDQGEIQTLDLGTGASRFDPNVEAHHHLLCVRCAAVHDVHADYPEVVVPFGERRGYTVHAADVVFRGICPTCAGGGTSQ